MNRAAYALTPDAESDLAHIVDYISQHSADNALKIFNKIHAAARKLANFPGMGHHRNDIADETLRVG
jgi:plasmid stabilization system protein ParE